MTEKAKANGSILKLVANQWKTAGVGQLVLIHNKHNPSEVLIKVIRSGKNDTVMFQCKPKAKPNGKSLILKGTDTKKKKEFVLALRFKDSGIMKFQSELEKVQRWSLKITKRHKRRPSQPPKDLRVELSQFAWDCELCTYRNEPKVFDCAVCNTPRPLKNRQPVKISSDVSTPPTMHNNDQSIQISNLPPVMTPKKTKTTAKFPDTSGIATINENEAAAPSKNEMVMVGGYDDEKQMKEPELNKSAANKKSVEEQEEDEKKQTIKELITNVTAGIESHNLQTRTIEDILLLCHGTFAASTAMLKILLDRCKESSIDFTTRARAVKMCESWIRQYWEPDFQEKDEMLDIMDNFVTDLDDMDNVHFAKLDDKDKRLLQRIKSTYIAQSNDYDIKSKQSLHKLKSKKLLGDIIVPPNYDPMDEKPTVVAEQLTLMDFELFHSIAKREMLGQGWKKKDKDRRSPHLLAMIKQFNQISKWVQCVVLSQRSKRQRAQIITKFIRIAVQLRELRNFSGCCAINFGLSATPIFRLKDAWNVVPSKNKTTYNEIQEIYKGKNNWAGLRVLHKNAHAPSILHTGLFLQDLLNTDEGNVDELRDGTVNFTKLKATYTLIEQICMYQQSQYPVKKNIILQASLRRSWETQASITEDTMYAMSSLCKKKDADGANIEPSEIDWFPPPKNKKKK